MPYIDPIESSPDHYTILLENEHVRMLEMIVPPGESDIRHSHPEKRCISSRAEKPRSLWKMVP
jgi:hypothetical protein